jgi:hypothetical protein
MRCQVGQSVVKRVRMPYLGGFQRSDRVNIHSAFQELFEKQRSWHLTHVGIQNKADLTLATFSSVPASVTLVVMTLCTLRLYMGTILFPRLFVLTLPPLVDSLNPLTPEIPLTAETLLVTDACETTDDALDNRRSLRFCLFSLSDEDGVVDCPTPSCSDVADLKTSL